MCEKVYIVCVQLNSTELQKLDRIVMNPRFQNFYWYIIFVRWFFFMRATFLCEFSAICIQYFQHNYVVANLQTESKLSFVKAHFKRSYRQARTSQQISLMLCTETLQRVKLSVHYILL